MERNNRTPLPPQVGCVLGGADCGRTWSEACSNGRSMSTAQSPASAPGSSELCDSIQVDEPGENICSGCSYSLESTKHDLSLFTTIREVILGWQLHVEEGSSKTIIAKQSQKLDQTMPEFHPNFWAYLLWEPSNSPHLRKVKWNVGLQRTKGYSKGFALM